MIREYKESYHDIGMQTRNEGEAEAGQVGCLLGRGKALGRGPCVWVLLPSGRLMAELSLGQGKAYLRMNAAVRHWNMAG